MNWPRLRHAFLAGPQPGSWWRLDGEARQVLGTALDDGSGTASVVFVRDGYVWHMPVSEWRKRAKRMKRGAVCR